MNYVYSHIRKDNNKCFYIGKGTGKRAWSTYKRNNYWNNIVNKCDYYVKILIDGISETKALELERDFISQIGLENLTNVQEGGQGGFSHTHTPEIIARRAKTLSKRKKGDKTSVLHMQTEQAKLNRAAAISRSRVGKLCKNVYTMHTPEIKEKAYNSRTLTKYIDNKGFTGTLREMKNKYPSACIQTRVRRGTPAVKGDYIGLTIKKL